MKLEATRKECFETSVRRFEHIQSELVKKGLINKIRRFWLVDKNQNVLSSKVYFMFYYEITEDLAPLFKDVKVKKAKNNDIFWNPL